MKLKIREAKYRGTFINFPTRHNIPVNLLKSILNYFNIRTFIFSDSNPLLQSEDIKADLTAPRSFLVQQAQGFPSKS